MKAVCPIDGATLRKPVMVKGAVRMYCKQCRRYIYIGQPHPTNAPENALEPMYDALREG